MAKRTVTQSGPIVIEQYDYEAKEYTNKRTGTKKLVQAHTDCYFYDMAGIEIACSHSGKVYVRTDKIGYDSRSPYERAINSPYKNAFKYLFKMLGADEKSVSEYTNA